MSTDLKQYGYEQSLKRVLPLSYLVFYGLAYLAPLTIFSTYGIVTNMTHGMLALCYILATGAMLFTAYSYSQMVKAYPMAGSVYSYVQRSINPHLGFLAGWAILMDYLLIPMINYLLISLFGQTIFPNIPAWVWILGTIAVVTVVNIVGIQVTAWANNILVGVQFVFLLALIIFIFKWISGGEGAGTFFDFSAILNTVEFGKEGMGWGIIWTGASILTLSYLGFDAVTTVAEEAIAPEKNVGRAIIIVCLGAGAMFIVVAYLMQLAWPNAWNEFQSVDTGAYELVAKVMGDSIGSIFTAMFLVGGTASAIACQSSASRILYGMGRDGALPKKFFAYLHPKFKTPVLNILMISLIGLTAFFMDLNLAISLVNFGALAGFTLVNISVIFHYFIRGKQRTGMAFVKYLLVPAIGAAIVFSIWLSLDSHSKTLGAIWLGLGIIYLASTTSFFKKLPPDLKMEE
jgi:amino acid transporter